MIESFSSGGVGGRLKYPGSSSSSLNPQNFPRPARKLSILARVVPTDSSDSAGSPPSSDIPFSESSSDIRLRSTRLLLEGLTHCVKRVKDVSPSSFALFKNDGLGIIGSGRHDPSNSSGLAGVTCNPVHWGGGISSVPRKGDVDLFVLTATVALGRSDDGGYTNEVDVDLARDSVAFSLPLPEVGGDEIGSTTEGGSCNTSSSGKYC